MLWTGKALMNVQEGTGTRLEEYHLRSTHTHLIAETHLVSF